MKRQKLAVVIGCSLLLTSQLAILHPAHAGESFRVKRPTATENVNDATVNGAASTTNSMNYNSGNNYQNKVLPAEVSIDAEQKPPLQATASVIQESQSIPEFRNAVLLWEQKNNPQKNNPNLQSQTATAASAHRGLKAHLGSAFLGMVSVAGTMTNSYIPIASVTNGYRSGALRDPTAPPSTISGVGVRVTPGHCPAMFDPAFQVPVRWWDTLNEEQQNPYFSPQWKLWLQAVQNTFEAHANELRTTPGNSAALHVIVNPDGTIFNISPYTGQERFNSSTPINEPMLMHLRDIVGRFGGFPPFPAGSRVRRYHLIFDAET